MAEPGDDDYISSSFSDVVWLHGAGLSSSTWRNDFGGIKPDFPGHNHVACITNPSVERYADYIEPQLPDRFALVGHSLGGMVALELAARHPQKVRGLVLAEAVPTVRQTTSSILLARLSKAIMSHVSPKRLAWLSGLAEPEIVRQHLHEQIGQMDVQGIKDGLEAAIQYDGRPHLPHIEAPTLVITGERNKATNAGAKLFCSSIGHARLVTMPGGHILHVENADQFYAVIFQFLGDKP
ncbi:alpha/beta fold hydrolase [Parasphingorhabdus cellanae]|uniref:Alpha/beta hydrolase n=1 Tax=Parasphingorhabdus cellanae TaxID=2806553 RepID=A0ABX7T987_9SPHN|nr:alpha/beta hydrolase [Parasphingorhabdus cellanae]QTD56608.1 alpha/beta hydrolase [Parasphingorhabdus cellanae]